MRIFAWARWRVTASFTRAAVEAGTLLRLLLDHVCEPLPVHPLLLARPFVPAKVRCFLEALEVHAHGSPAEVTEPCPVTPFMAIFGNHGDDAASNS